MLRTSRVVLAPLTEADLPRLFQWINDREQVLFNAPYKPVHAGAHREWFESIRKRPDVVIFGIRLIHSGKLIGSCQLHSIHPVHRSAEFQIRIGEVRERGKGYGLEAVRLLLDHAFRDLNLRRVFLHVYKTNRAVLRLYEKAGFVREGELRRAAYVNGRYVDVIVMGILRAEHVRS
jgi:RimJ/RimL family protein N-acetyltransferase